MNDKNLTRKDLANYLDTPGCVYAYGGDYDGASAAESEAASISATPEFKQRQEMFHKGSANRLYWRALAHDATRPTAANKGH